ncbi:hypothetical protein ACUR5C_09210 [Aliikangiella sp. IMCC44653]
MPKAYFKYAVRTLILTAICVVSLNFACANGAGVQILNALGTVADSQVTERDYILQGVDFMQLTIKVFCAIGLLFFVYFIFRGFQQLSFENE